MTSAKKSAASAVATCMFVQIMITRAALFGGCMQMQQQTARAEAQIIIYQHSVVHFTNSARTRRGTTIKHKWDQCIKQQSPKQSMYIHKSGSNVCLHASSVYQQQCRLASISLGAGVKLLGSISLLQLSFSIGSAKQHVAVECTCVTVCVRYIQFELVDQKMEN